MPKLKQPTPLERIAFDVLLKCVVQCCDQLSADSEDSLDEFRRGISVIKNDVYTRIPSVFVAEFSNRFLDEFSSVERPACYRRAALEIVMDVEIIGLKCKGPIVAHLDPEDGHRFRGLEELDLDSFPDTIPIALENFRLDDLTTFIFPRHCDDLDLSIVGQSCPNLQVVKIRESKNVTDDGLRALNPCAELRVVDIVRCPRVSHIGISWLLSTHEKLEDLAYGDKQREYVLLFSHLDSTAQCPSMNRFYIESGVFSEADLHSIVEKFPNLTYLGINDFLIDSWSELTALNKLTKFEFGTVACAPHPSHCQYRGCIRMWTLFKQILPCIGVNMISLSFLSRHEFFLRQKDLDFIFNSCPNIEYLRFYIRDGHFIIPEFQKLTELAICCYAEANDWYISTPKPIITFSKMSSLETLTFFAFRPSARAIKSIIFDDVKFPNLSLIETYSLTDDELLELERKVRIKNLNFQIKNHRKRSFTTSRIHWEGLTIEPETINYSCRNLLEILN